MTTPSASRYARRMVRIIANVRHQRMRALAFITAAVLAAGASGDDSTINALWNDSGTKGERGFWIYPVSGECPALRTKGKPLVFSPKVLQSELSVSDLQYCFHLPERPDAPLLMCQSGIVRLSQDVKSKRYRGTYSFVMADGSKREGTFYAQYCAKDDS